MTVKAGTHEIACKLANGYSGEAKFAIVDSMTSDSLDASVSGNKVSIPGEERRAVLVQITSISSSGYTPAPAEPIEDKDNGLFLTDILLIVLVVLIVILAVIIALRLMLSRFRAFRPRNTID